MQIKKTKKTKLIIGKFTSFIACVSLMACNTLHLRTHHNFAPEISVVLDPSCNTRTVATEYENNVGFLYAESMRHYFCNHTTTHIIEITRGAGEKLDEYEAATFSNKLQPDLHISLHFTSTKQAPRIYIYYFDHGNYSTPQTDQTIALCTAQDAYRTNQQQSKKYAQTCYNLLQKKYGENITFTPPIGCPFKPLCGVIAPAIALEINIENLESSELFQEMLLEIIEQIPQPHIVTKNANS